MPLSQEENTLKCTVAIKVDRLLCANVIQKVK